MLNRHFTTFLIVTFGGLLLAPRLAPSVPSEPPAAARMTGGGQLTGPEGVLHVLHLHCDPDRGANRLSLSWDAGETFELSRVTSGICQDDPAVEPGGPPANFDTHRGEGTGLLSGRDGASVRWKIIDAGEPGTDDIAKFVVSDADGNVVLEVSGRIKGNHQAHGTALLPAIPGVDPDNTIARVELGFFGRSSGFEVEAIPETAFFEEPHDPAPKPDEVPITPAPKLHPELERLIDEGNPGDPVAILVSLVDDVPVPRFPDLPRGVMRDSAEAAPFVERQEQLIEQLRERRRATTESFLASFDYEVDVTDQFWLIPAFVAEVRVSTLSALRTQEEIAYVHPADLAVAPAPPSHDAFWPHADPVLARARMGSEAYFNQAGMSEGYFGLLDTGVGLNFQGTPSHILLSPPNGNLAIQANCEAGGPSCRDSSLPNYQLFDCWNHGIASAALFSGNDALGFDIRGVTDIQLDSWKTSLGPSEQSPHCWGTLTDPVVLGFQRGIQLFDRVFAAVVQLPEPDHGITGSAADAAFDAGAVVLAANGNCAVSDKCDVPTGLARPATVRGPANAHKVLGVGEYNIISLNTRDFQGRGPTNDGRVKPDIQAPTDVGTADQESNVALQLRFTGTSAATPLAAGAAALQRNWFRKFNYFDPGHTYARMILSGDRIFDDGYSNVHGAGHFQLSGCGLSEWGKVKIQIPRKFSASVVEIPIEVASLHKSFKAALWWPESGFGTTHNDIDLFLIDPDGVEQARAYSGPSVWERTEVDDPMPGAWKLKILSADMEGLSQDVYWSVHLPGCRVKQIFLVDQPLRILLDAVKHFAEQGLLGPMGAVLEETAESATDLNDAGNGHGIISALQSFAGGVEAGADAGEISEEAAEVLLQDALEVKLQLEQWRDMPR